MLFRLFCFRKKLLVVRWKRVDGGTGDGKDTEGTSLRFWICSGLLLMPISRKVRAWAGRASGLSKDLEEVSS